MKKFVSAVLVLCIVLAASAAMAGVSKGKKELGLSGSINNQDSSTTFNVIVNYGKFFTNELQGSGNVMYMGGEGFDLIYLQGQAKYHFIVPDKPELVPYMGGQAGIGFIDFGSGTDNSLGFGAMGGLKNFISENVSVNGELNLWYDIDMGEVATSLLFGYAVYFQ